MKHVFFACLLAACNDSTGSALVEFSARAAGPSDATSPMQFTSGSGYAISLVRAKMHLGAVYLNQQVPLSGRGSQPCMLPGIYVGQAFGPLDLDLLSPAPIAFPDGGDGTATTAHTGEVWLLEGDINQSGSTTVVFDVEGLATKGGAEFPFTAQVTIGDNRQKPAPNVATPGANPICQERIVTGIPTDITAETGGTLTLRVDPRKMFDGIDFAVSFPTPTLPFDVIPDEAGGVGGQLFSGFINDTAYAFEWN